MSRPGTPRRPAARRDDGFTLIETAIGLVLFSVVLLAAGGLITTLAVSGLDSRTRTAATHHLQSQIERLYELDYAALANGTADTLLPNGSRLRASWEVTEVVQDRLARVDVTVQQLPTGPGGRETGVRIFIANRDP